jgi:hypothetical protein
LSITFLAVGCILNIIFDRLLWVCPFHISVFALWIIAVDQHFVPSDSASQEVAVIVITVQKLLADIQA